MTAERITGETRLLAVIGHPIAHSLSPEIHNRFAEAFRLPYAYMAFDIPEDGLKSFCDAARLLSIAGFNVTMPYKERILPHMDVLGESALRHGAVNTVVLREGVLEGHNTDGDGFVMSLRTAGFNPKGKAVILGSGGASKAVATALAEEGMEVRVVSRRVGNAPYDLFGIPCIGWADLPEAAQDCTLLVNATPLGMEGMREDFADLTFVGGLPHSAVVCDLIYAPRETRLLRAARARNLHALNGLGHLVCQAALSFAHFTGYAPALETIAELLEGGLL